MSLLWRTATKPPWLEPGVHEGVDPEEFIQHVRPTHPITSEYHVRRAMLGLDMGPITVHLRDRGGPHLWDGNHRVNAAVQAKKDCPAAKATGTHRWCDHHGLTVHTLHQEDDPEWQATQEWLRERQRPNPV